jgi:hypothetical protein
VAVAVLEGGREAEEAREHLARAEKEGLLPPGVDIENTDHLVALARAEEGAAAAAAQGAPIHDMTYIEALPAEAEGDAAPLVAAGIAALLLL